MASGGRRAGSGRPKGARDVQKKLATAVDSMFRTDDAIRRLIPDRKFASMLPMDVLFFVMAHHMEREDFREAAMVASILMPYTAPKLAAMELTAVIETRDVDELSDTELASLARHAANSDLMQDDEAIAA